MTDKELEAASFSKLVQAIDEKWSHTYEDLPEQPDYTDELRQALDLVAIQESDFDAQY